MEHIKSSDDDDFPNGGTGVRLGRIVVVLTGVAALSATLVTFVYGPVASHLLPGILMLMILM